MLQQIFPLTCQVIAEPLPAVTAEEFHTYLQSKTDIPRRLPYICELAALEMAVYQLAAASTPPTEVVDRLKINPTLQVLESPWTGLPEFFLDQTREPVSGGSLILLYLTKDGRVGVQTAGNGELLALKIVAEGLDSRDIARQAGTPVAAIDASLAAAAESGLLLAPASQLVRDNSYAPLQGYGQEFHSASIFTLQWHLTQACDLHCRHCYDRGQRASISFDRARAVLDDLYDFVRNHHVAAQVSFSGGNPLLSPYFFEIYREAADRGFQVAILGNPTSDENLDRILDIARPAFYQVSLEGLREHNDHIRGAGHFARVFDFLARLRRRSIYSMVMLTLTRANACEVIELATVLEGRADLFTFNRLAMFGEGAALTSVEVDRFPGFLKDYLQYAESRSFVSLKDNFFNLLQHDRGRLLTGGCTGFGCGAAFNFFSLLPDGEVHACRKFPSPIGNVHDQTLAEIYHGEAAARYRGGPSDCLNCRLRPVCKGCMAVARGFGRDPFKDRDPYCFRDELPSAQLLCLQDGAQG